MNSPVVIPETLLSQIVEEYTAAEAAQVIRAIQGLPPEPMILDLPTSWPSAFVKAVALVCITFLILHFYP